MNVKMSPEQAVEAARTRVRACLRQTLMVVLINIPTMSFGLAMGWVSLASGEGAEGAEGGEGAAVAAAAVTFGASLAGVPISARALAAGRKPAVIATSVMFVACWSLKLCGGGWWVVGARACAGLGGASAWTLAPLLAREMCSEGVRGAAVAALVVASNLGVLLMYLLALCRVPHQTILVSCLSVSVVHCVLYVFVPESPQYLAARGHTEKARESLAWLRGVSPDAPELIAELAQLPAQEKHVPPLKLLKNMLSDAGRRRAFILCCVLVVGQEACGVLAVMQFAERVFVLARDQPLGDAASLAAAGTLGDPAPLAAARPLGEPALYAVALGVAQLVASLLALYLVERVGRKRLVVWCGALTGAALGAGAGAARRGAAGALALALAAAVFADSAGLQPAPYAMLADMFDYEYRGCAMLTVGALAWAGNLVEVLVFPALAARAGLAAALALAAALTLALAAAAHIAAPETKGRSTADIYRELLGRTTSARRAAARAARADCVTVTCDETVVTKM